MRTFAQKPKATQQGKPASSVKASPTLSSQRRDMYSILQLQRTIGNQGVQRLLRTDSESPEVELSTTPGTRFAHDFSRVSVDTTTPVRIQRQLTVNAPGDIYEEEAERVAEQVMRMPESRLQHGCACGGGCPTCQAESAGHGRLQTERDRASDTEPVAAPPIVHEVLQSPGQSIDPVTRGFMESRFGHDFSRVRVHTDRQAAQSAADVEARAYTVGQHVVFGTGEYAPGTNAGNNLIAHELAHTIQQDTNVVHRQAPPGPPAGLAGLTATRDAFNDAGAPDPNNCAAVKPAALGVDGPAVGQNGMELVFRINGAIPPGTEFEISRTKATGVWQQNGGVWTRLGGWPAGTSDDHNDDDECHTPVGGRIFVVDIPGPAGSLNLTGVALPNAAPVAAAATAVVWKLNFAEWVMARNRPLGIGWTRISTPTFHWWHSILSVARVAGVWTRVNTPSGKANEIKLGQTATTGATP